MQAINPSKNLSLAINYLEEALNEQDGKILLDTIKKYKETKSSDCYEVENFKID